MRCSTARWMRLSSLIGHDGATGYGAFATVGLVCLRQEKPRQEGPSGARRRWGVLQEPSVCPAYQFGATDASSETCRRPYAGAALGPASAGSFGTCL
jgi:hypothetical protein